MKPNDVVCPRCDNTGEEPGAPVDLDGVWVCSLCKGKGVVTQQQAEDYELDHD